MIRIAFATCLAVVMTFSATARAQTVQPTEEPPEQQPPLELTFEGALALARQSSPTALVAPFRIREAEAARVEASIYPRYNPVLELELGPRLIGQDPQSVVFAVGLSQNLDLGGGVGARQRRVGAQIDGARADGDAAMQQTLRSVGLAFMRSLWAEERVALATQIEAIARSVHHATGKRLQAGDATALEVNVSRGGLARAVAERKGAEATLDAAHAELRVLLGLAPSAPLVLKGSLDTPRPIDRAALGKAAQSRGDVRALAADLAAAEADDDLADALAAPQLSIGARYELEDKEQHTILGTLTMTLPIFDHAQGLAAQAEAKAARARAELGVRKAQIAAEVATATRVADKRAEASAAFVEEKGVASFEENVRLATKGYDAGETSLGEVLLVRRELIDTEGARIDRLLEVRNAEIELLYAAGMLR